MRDAAEVDAVAEPVQQRRQHRQRADHRGGTTIIVPTPIVANSELPETNMPAIAISTVAPEISTAWPDVRAAREQRLVRRASPLPLLALPAQVEERVVDPDGEADHHDDRGDRLRRPSARGG